jgi:hypothetical protein
MAGFLLDKQTAKYALFKLGFLVSHMLAGNGIVFADLHFLRHGLFVFGRGVEMTGARRGLQFDFFALDLFATGAQIG